MKKTVVCLIIMMGVVSLHAREMTETWSGTADPGVSSLRLVFHIDQSSGTMDSPDQGASVNLVAIRNALAAGGNTDLTVIEYPSLNHLFQTTETGAIQEYGQIGKTISPTALEDITAWILKITK
jgi:hypothetical protein